MKKIYAFLAAAFVSVSLFAATPTPTDLANLNYDVNNNVVLCVHFIDEAEVCNNVYFVGSHSGWAESFDGCPQFRELTGFPGWYAAQAEYAEYDGGFQGKPIQAKMDGSFSWDYQTGDPTAWAFVGGLEANITSGYDGEANISYPQAGAYIYEVSFWKNHRTPCVAAVTHDYTIILYAPECEETEYIPAVIGDFNSWSEGVQMNADFDEDINLIYVATFNNEEGHQFKFRQAGISDWSNQIQVYNEKDDAYMDNPNVTLGAETTIILNYADGKWSACGQAPADSTVYKVIVGVNVPAGAPAAGIEIIGDFDDWTGTAMSYNTETGWYIAYSIEAMEFQEFKFREAGSWDNEIVTVADGKGLKNIKFGDVWFDETYKGDPVKMIELDYSADTYTWLANWVAPEEGIENIVLTEKAQKVVVDGVIYIVRDKKMFNLQGAQVR